MLDFAARQRWMNAVIASSDLVVNAKLVAIRVALFLNVETARCFPSKATLAQATALNVRTVDRAINTLVTSGWLAVEGSIGRRANNYALRFPGGLAPMNPVTQTPVEALNPGARTPSTPAPRPPQHRTEHKTSSFEGCRAGARAKGPSGRRWIARSDPNFPALVAIMQQRNPAWRLSTEADGYDFPCSDFDAEQPRLRVVGGCDPPP